MGFATVFLMGQSNVMMQLGRNSKAGAPWGNDGK
jgi:hypothetical protein